MDTLTLPIETLKDDIIINKKYKEKEQLVLDTVKLNINYSDLINSKLSCIYSKTLLRSDITGVEEIDEDQLEWEIYQTETLPPISFKLTELIKSNTRVTVLLQEVTHILDEEFRKTINN